MWNKIKYMMNKSQWQNYNKLLSDKSQLPFWIKRKIYLLTAMEINLAMFTVYKWQSIKLLWNKSKFWDFSILTMTSKPCRGMQFFFARQVRELKFAIRLSRVWNAQCPDFFSSSFQEGSSLFQNILPLLYAILLLLQFLMKPLHNLWYLSWIGI